MKKGDHIIFTTKNKHWLYGGVSAYAPFEGTVLDLWEDNGFSIIGSGILICSLNKSNKVHVILNGQPMWIRRKRKPIFQSFVKALLRPFSFA